MNIGTRTFNPLLGNDFRFAQSEESSLKYVGNWGPLIQGNDIVSSTWSVENGTVTVSSESNGTQATEAVLSGPAGESAIVNTVALTDGQIEQRKILLRINYNSDPYYNSDYDNS